MRSIAIQPCVDKYFVILEAKWEREEQPGNDDFKRAVTANVGERVRIRLWFDKNDIDEDEDITVSAEIIDAQTREVLRLNVDVPLPLEGEEAVSEPFQVERDWLDRDLLISVVQENNPLLLEDYSHQQSTFRVNKPWVRDAYFARKVVAVAENGDTGVSFERVRGSTLGKTVYLVVETLNMQAEEFRNLRITVRPRVQPIRVPVRAPLFAFPPSAPRQAEDIETNALHLMRFNAGQYAAERVLTATVGNSDALNNNANECNYTNLADHADKAIIKLQLRPENRAEFDALARDIELAQRNDWQIFVQRANNTERALFANNHKLIFTGTFIDRLVVNNRSFYEIYHGNSTYNFLRMQGDNRRRVGYVGNTQSRQVVYFYYDQHDREHRISEVEKISVQRWSAGSRHFQAGWEVRRFGNNVRYFQRDGNVQTDLVPLGLPWQYERDGVVIVLRRNATPRLYISPSALACLIGAIAQCGFRDITCTGFACQEGIGGPSVSHYNGYNGDFRYLRTDANGEPTLVGSRLLDIDRQNALHRAFHAYGWARNGGTLASDYTRNGTLLEHCRYLADHEDHLHIEGFHPNIDNLI
ncbi:MAG: hypothetical protein LBI15_11955 [Dysgonamonadaceae bacterium]|nr:hypothetical protein [Dysgonamonadaceae bacterium]